MKNTIFAALFVGILSFPAFADGDPADSAAPPDCKKPTPPSSVRRADDTSEFNEKLNDYQECIKTYVAAQNKLANLHINAANKAVEDANAYVRDINEKLSAPK